MYDFDSMFPGYTVSESGHVFKDGFQVHECKSNKYLQVYIYDYNHKGHVLGVHTVVAMKYLDYYTGCVVHHIDGDPHNNSINNLKILSTQDCTIKTIEYSPIMLRKMGLLTKVKRCQMLFDKNVANLL